MRELIAMVLLGAALVPVSAGAAEDAGRYRLEKSGEGYVRMDTATGRMSICREREERLVCAPAADERGVRDDEVETLRRRVDALEARIAALEGDRGTGADAEDPGLPSEEDFEQSLDFMDRFFRRFMGIVKDLETEEGEAGTPPDASPSTDRT